MWVANIRSQHKFLNWFLIYEWVKVVNSSACPVYLKLTFFTLEWTNERLPRLGISIVSTKVERKKVNGGLLLILPRPETIMGRSTNINISYILINVKKIGECYSAINRLRKFIIEKYVFLFFFGGGGGVSESCIFLPFDDVVYDCCQHYKLRTNVLH